MSGTPRIVGAMSVAAALSCSACMAGTDQPVVEKQGSTTVYRSGNSTNVVTQTPSTGKSSVSVQQDANGQTIIRKDGASTDVTIQRNTPANPSSTTTSAPSAEDAAAFKRRMEDRFTRDRIPTRAVPSQQDRFRQDMEQRFNSSGRF